jgi:hypothetical protein
MVGKNDILNNLFLNEKYFKLFFNPKLRLKRVNDIYKLTEFYKKYKLFDQNKNYNINKKLLEKWINSHKTDEDKYIAKILIDPIVHVSLEEFKMNLIHSVNKFNDYIKSNNIKKYYIIIGANKLYGTNQQNYLDIGKSNFWTLLITLPYLIIKPYDILLNLSQAIEYSIFEKLKKQEIVSDFVFFDDCSYSGSQLFQNVIDFNLLQKYYLNAMITNPEIEKININNLNKKENKLIKVHNEKPNIHIHVIIPYISLPAKDLAFDIQTKRNIGIHLYNNYFIKSYKDFYKFDEILLNKLEDTYALYGFNKDLIPLYFDHKMPDGVSTIDYILLSGIVSNYSDSKKDNKKLKKKFVQFINNCIYPSNKLMNPFELKKWEHNTLCPVSPYKEAKKFIENYIQKSLASS